MENNPLNTYLYGSEGVCDASSFPLISRPQLIPKLLKTVTEVPDEEALDLLSKLLVLLDKTPLSAILTAYQSDTICLTIEGIINSSKKQTEFTKNLHELWLRLLEALITSCSPLKQHYEKVYEKLGKIMSSCVNPGDAQKNIEVLITSLELLKKLATVPKYSEDQPSSYFYFMPNSSYLSANLPKESLWPFVEGITIAMWIRIELNYAVLNSFPVLFRIRGSANGFECYLVNNSLNYRVLSSSYSKPSTSSNGIQIGQVQSGTWQFLAISHSSKGKSSKLTVCIDSEIQKYIVDYPKFPKKAHYLEQVFFENLVCSVSSVLISETPMDIKKIGTRFPLGVYKLKDIAGLSEFNIGKTMHCWTPLRTIERTIFNACDRSYAILNGNSGAHILNKRLIYLDKISNVVPFFCIVPLLNITSAKKLLTLVLELSFVYFEKLYSASFSSFRFTRETKCFVRSFGFNLLHYDPLVIDADIIRLIGDIMSICPRLKRKILKMFMTTINYWVNIEADLLFWEVIKASIVSNIESFTDIINTNVLIDIMEAMNSSLRGSSCCNVHCVEENVLNLGGRYDNMKYLLKLFIIHDIEVNSQNVSRVINAITSKPCPCLFISLVNALKEAAKVDLTCVRTLHKMHAIGSIFKAAKNYPMDVKVACVALAAVAFSQNKDETLFKTEFKNPLLELIGAPIRQQSSKSVKGTKEEGKRLRPMISISSTTLNKVLEFDIPENKEHKVEGTVKKPRKSLGTGLFKSSAFNSGRRKFSYEFNNKDKEPKHDPFEKDAKIQDVQSTSGVLKNPFIAESNTQGTIDEVLDDNIEILYASILYWIIGSKPEQALEWKTEDAIIEIKSKSSIVNTEIQFLLLELVKTLGIRSIAEQYLNDLIILSKSNPNNINVIKDTEGFINWLVLLEIECYNEAINTPDGNCDIEAMKLAFELHLKILSTSLNMQNDIKFVLDYFITSAYKINFDSLIKSKEGNIGWSCLKYLWVELIKRIKELKVISIFTEITVYLVLCHYLIKGQEVDVESYNNSFIDDNLNSLATYRVSGMETISQTIDRLIEVAGMNEEFVSIFMLRDICKTQKLEQNMLLLENGNGKELQFINKEQGYTNFSLILLNLGLINSTSADINNWLKRIRIIIYHICLLIEYATCKGHSKVVKSETKNLLLTLAILMHKHKVDLGNQKQVNETLCEVLMYILQTATEFNGEIKEFIKKTLGIDEALAPKLFQKAKNCSSTGDLNLSILANSEGKMVKAFERLSNSSLEMLRNEFKRVAELIIKKQELVQKNTGSKFKVSLRLPGILGRFSSIQCEESPEIYRDETIARLSKNQAKIPKWTRKWIKILKYQKQWQGAWRDHSIFDNLSQYSKLPLTLSTHTFANGARCLMKLRIKKTKCLPVETLPKSSITSLNDTFFTLMSSICIESNNSFDFTSYTKDKRLLWGCDYSLTKEKSLSKVLYEEIPSNVRKQLVEPMECEIYTPLHAKKGKILIYYKEGNEEYYIKLVLCKDIVMTEDKRLMFTFIYEPQSKLVKKWKVKIIKAIYKKYIVDQKSAIEVLFHTGKCVLFNFKNEIERDKFCGKLLGIKGMKIDCYPKGGKHQIKELMNNWIHWKISNFDYIMALNNLSGRSFNNVSQYPVFPWIIDDLKSQVLQLNNKDVYRNLAANVGMLGDQARAKLFKERYKSENIPGLGQFNFGSHYSNPGIIFQFMMRVSPFIEAYIKFFSGLDSPDRMFHSIEESWSITKSDPNDVRELIPEFFTVPDILINREGFLYGKREETKDDVHDILLPYWAKGSPYRFIQVQREALESDCVSKQIDKWINLIFGYQQQGKEAEKVSNVFPKLSYESETILPKLTGSQKESFMMQAYHWGQTPSQLLGKKHKERLVKDPNIGLSILDKNAQIKCVQKISNTSSHKRVVKIFTSEGIGRETNFILITIDGRYIECTVNILESDSTKTSIPQLVCSSIKRYKNYYFDNGIMNVNPLISSRPPVVLVKKNNPPYLVHGGYLNGLLVFIEFGQNKTSFLRAHKDSVTCLEIDKEERIAASGSATGEVVMYEILKDMKWVIRKQMWHHTGAVTHIFMSSQMLLFSTAGIDGVVNLYSYSGSLIRKFLTPIPSPVKYVNGWSNSRLLWQKVHYHVC